MNPVCCDLVSKALLLADAGFPCFPCGQSKSPATPHGFKQATTDRDELHRLWSAHPGPLIGVPTGEISGIDVIDIDARHGGGTWFTEHRHRLPATRVHRTRSGGLHVLLQHQPGLRCSVRRIASGVDVRADGGYIIWWPAADLPILSDVAVAPWPEWLRGQLTSFARPSPPRMVVPDTPMLMRLVRTIVNGKPGERNSLTFWAACRAGEMVSSGLLRDQTAVAIIVEAACRAGLPCAEAERTAWSGIRTAGGRTHA